MVVWRRLPWRTFLTCVLTSSTLGTAQYVISKTLVTSSTTYTQPYLYYAINNGSTVNVTVRIGMPQMELGSFPTSVIPTSGTAVTRQADTFTIPAGGWYTAGQGTLAVNTTIPYSSSVYPTGIELDDGTGNNDIVLYTSSGYLGATIYNSGTATYSGSGTAYTFGTLGKAVVAYKANDAASAVNGSLRNVGTPSSLPTVSALRLGAGRGNQNFLNGWINRGWYTPSREPNASLPDYTR